MKPFHSCIVTSPKAKRTWQLSAFVKTLSLTTTYNNLLISCRLSQSSCFPQHQCQQQHQQFLSCIYISQSHINQVDKTGVSLSMKGRLRPGKSMLFAKFNQVGGRFICGTPQDLRKCSSIKSVDACFAVCLPSNFVRFVSLI